MRYWIFNLAASIVVGAMAGSPGFSESIANFDNIARVGDQNLIRAFEKTKMEAAVVTLLRFCLPNMNNKRKLHSTLKRSGYLNVIHESDNSGDQWAHPTGAPVIMTSLENGKIVDCSVLFAKPEKTRKRVLRLLESHFQTDMEFQKFIERRSNGEAAWTVNGDKSRLFLLTDLDDSGAVGILNTGIVE
ncbi:MAG: hypothetical protein GY947_21510 [Rhodobacteraceae bacterium]|nr:hypothetical protein [Paracoccaceae bacterium]